MPLDLLQHPVVFLDPLSLSDTSAWVEHTPFAALLVDLLRPRTLVELGTSQGDSYLAFCQAVKHLGAPTRCSAIDTWRGDEHAGRYGQDILERLRAKHDALYSSFSTLTQSTFDEAVGRFPDASIDLLHIDGLHTYDAVKHDFETWKPKLSDRAVVLFHDTQEREEDFGVWKLWAEASRGRPHLEFLHGHGLGVLAVGPNVPGAAMALFDSNPAARDSIRDCFRALGHRQELRRSLSFMLAGFFRAQQEVNKWKASLGVQIRPVSATPDAARKDPVLFCEGLMADISGLVQDDTNARAMLARLAAQRTPGTSPGTPPGTAPGISGTGISGSGITGPGFGPPAGR